MSNDQFPMQNKEIKNPPTNYLLLATFFIAAISERIFFDLGPNVELVTMAIILSAFYFGRNESIWLTLAIIVFSDLIIGNSNIFICTWSGFLIPALFSKNLINRLTGFTNKLNTQKLTKPLTLTLTGVSANLFFYLWTNFGVWLMGSMYSKTAGGLIMSYINGLPFLKPQIISSVVFIPLAFVLTESGIILARWLSLKYKFHPLSFRT